MVVDVIKWMVRENDPKKSHYRHCDQAWEMYRCDCKCQNLHTKDISKSITECEPRYFSVRQVAIALSFEEIDSCG